MCVGYMHTDGFICTFCYRKERYMMELLGKATDKDFWKEVRESDVYKKQRDQLLDKWEKLYREYQAPALKYSEFKLFWTTGDRSIYQASYFEMMHAMEVSALLAIIYPDEDKYLIKLMDVIYAICDQYTWCLPAHQGKLEPNNNCRIDLFASETGFAFAEILTILGDRLEPLIRNRIMAEVERRIVIPFTSVEDYGWWEKGHTNWTAVCMGSIACTMMLLFPEKADEQFIKRANNSMDCFLDGFKDDGICLEGVGYWGYGFGFFMMYADMVRRYTDGKTDFFKRDKVRTIATFPQKMFISGNCGVSFSDGGRKMGYDIGRLHYLKNEYPNDIVLPDVAYAGTGGGKFCTHLRCFTWYKDEYVKNPDVSDADAEYYAPDSQWFVKKCARYGFAAKGGSNNEPHNHNDVGSFIYAKDGKQVLCDIGSGLYTRQYFSKDTRYQMLETSSYGHSVPIIGGNYQKAGAEYAASNAKYENGVFTLDLAGAYGLEECRSILRSFSFDNGEVRVSDVFDCDTEIIERFMTLEEPVVKADGEIEVDGTRLCYESSACELEINSETTSKNAVVYSINFKLKDGVKSFSLVIN